MTCCESSAKIIIIQIVFYIVTYYVRLPENYVYRNEIFKYGVFSLHSLLHDANVFIYPFVREIIQQNGEFCLPYFLITH